MTPGAVLNGVFLTLGIIVGALVVAAILLVVVPMFVIDAMNVIQHDERDFRWVVVTCLIVYAIELGVITLILFYSGTLAAWWGHGWAVPV